MLRALIRSSVLHTEGGYTPSDFPLAKLDQQMLDKLCGQRRDIEDIYPLSPLQHGLLFHTLYAPQSAAYFQQFHCELNEELDQAAFLRAWEQVIERHPILRSSFAWEGLDGFLQIVSKKVSAPHRIIDWSEAPRDKLESCFESFLKEDRRNGFDLSKAPLMRLTTIHGGPRRHWFVWSFHHILLDGWSTPQLLKEVFAFYEANRRGEILKPEPTRPFRDYIAWIQQGEGRAPKNFWREYLKGFYAPTPLGLDIGGELLPSQDEAYGIERTSLTFDETAALKSLARRQQLTVNTFVQAAWAMLLSRYSGEEEVLFGIVVSSRPPALKGVEAMIGLFINTIPLRVRVPADEPLTLWLRNLQLRQAELRDYEHTPLVQIQGWSDVARGMPLFESVLVYENYPSDSSLRHIGSRLGIRNVHVIENTSYPLTVEVLPDKEMGLELWYDSRRFDPSSVIRMLRQLKNLLLQMVERPESLTGSFSLAGDEELSELSRAFSQPEIN